MACILLWSSAVRVHDSQASRKKDVTREHISRILELREILLSFQTGFTFSKSHKSVLLLCSSINLWLFYNTSHTEIQDPSVVNPDLKGSPSKARSRSGYSHECFTYCQGFVPCTVCSLAIQLHFFPKPLPSFCCASCG